MHIHDTYSLMFEECFQGSTSKSICLHILIVFVADPLESITEKGNRKLPAWINEPGTKGWLCHADSLLHFTLWHLVLTVTFVKLSVTSTAGLSVLQNWQNWKSSNNWDRKATYLGSDLILEPARDTLEQMKIERNT